MDGPVSPQDECLNVLLSFVVSKVSDFSSKFHICLHGNEPPHLKNTG